MSFFTTNDLLEDISKYRRSLMGISILMVLLYHQRWIYGGIFSWFHNYGELGVDLFFFLSGIGIWHSLEKNTKKKYILNRVNRLLVPCVLVGVLKSIGIYFGYGNGVVKIKRLLSLDLWFIVAIIAFYFIAPFIHLAIRRYRWRVFPCAILLGMIALLPFVPNFPWEMTIGRFPAFVLGMCICACPFFLRKEFFFISLTTCFVIPFLTNHSALQYLVFCFAIPIVILYICQLLRVGGTLVQTCFTVIGSCSLEIYLWHEYIFAVTTNEISHVATSSWLQFCCAIIFTAIAVFYTHKLCKNYKLF